jgi:NAD(P)H-dependent flavin oxidoreductase YrpB (nitropropane dioxygenase family)
MASAHDFTLFILNPAGLIDPALAIAGCRAGAVGVLNAEARIEPVALAEALFRLAATRRPFGLKWSNEALPERLAVKPDWLILDAVRNAHLLAEVQDLRAGGGRVLLELSHWRDEWADWESRIDGWWVKGHEAGGAVGEESSFVLLQRLLNRTALPVYVRGGVGLHTAAACRIGGAAGAVLESSLLLLRESPLTEVLRPWLQGLDGTETVLLGREETGCYLRVLERPGFAPVEALRRQLQAGEGADSVEMLEKLAGWREPLTRDVLSLGQDVAFAAHWAARYDTVAEVIRALRQALTEHPVQALRDAALVENAPLARMHGTRFPVVQGAMTRVSDCPEFAEAVAADSVNNLGAWGFSALYPLRCARNNWRRFGRCARLLPILLVADPSKPGNWTLTASTPICMFPPRPCCGCSWNRALAALFLKVVNAEDTWVRSAVSCCGSR